MSGMRLLLILAVFVGGAPLLSQAATPVPSRPNFLIVLVDDMRADEISVMPETRARLADTGVTLDAFFATTSQCCPSRATLLTGRYAHHHGVVANNGTHGGADRFVANGWEDDNVATRLHAAGYQTGFFGRYLNEYGQGDKKRVPPGWDDWAAFVRAQAANEPNPDGLYFGYQLNVNGTVAPYGTRDQDLSTDVLTGKVDAFVRQATRDDTPFLALLATSAPHNVPAWPSRHDGLFRDAGAPRSPAFNEVDVRDKPAWVRGLASLDGNTRQAIDRRYRQRARSLQAVDEAVARLDATLHELGIADTTYMLFLSDNGYHLGEHRITKGKQTAYEPSIRVPFLMRGPAIPTGTTTRALAGMHDLAPTLLDLAGAPVPAAMDGRSLRPIISGGDPPPWRSGLLVEWADKGDTGKMPPVPAFSGVRADQWVYIAYITGERELYDLADDPLQLNNRAGAGLAVEDTLAAQLARLRACTGNACREADGG